MVRDLRLTGENPSPGLLERYPNWENALGEEGEDGQDETTLRPADEQTVIERYLPFTAATAWLNDGRACPAMIELLISGVSALQLYLAGQWYRIVRHTDRFEQFERWEPYVESWLPEEERTCGALSLNDCSVFPLRFVSRLPYYKTSSPITTTIAASGGEMVEDQ